MSKKTQFTRSKNKIGSLSWTSQIYTHGEGKYQNKILQVQRFKGHIYLS